MTKKKKPAQVVVKFFPTIADRYRNVERKIGLAGTMSVLEFIEMMKGVEEFKGYFERISEYGASDNFLADVIVIINNCVAEDQSCLVAEGDVVKLILPLAGG